MTHPGLSWRILLGGPTLHLAVVPLGEVVAHDGDISEPGQLAGIPCASQRAREDERVRVAREAFAYRNRLRLPDGLERDVATPGVTSGKAPLGLAVPDGDEPGDRVFFRHAPIRPSGLRAGKLEGPVRGTLF